MKQEQKELIRSLRLQGWGYKRIAKEMRLNRNQVQLYCKTHGLAGAGEFVKLNLPISQKASLFTYLQTFLHRLGVP